MQGKTALVTGSTSGIGRQVAISLAEAGANIVLSGFGNAKQIQEVKDAISKANNNVKVGYNSADMSKAEEIKSMVSYAEKEIGEIDILVNNAGIQHVDNLEDFPEEKWQAIIDINLSSAFHLTKAVIKNMQKNSWGRIINIASAHGLVASAKKSAYVSAKHGIVGLTKVTALENATKGITCNAICPGWVLTPLVAKQIDAIKDRENISFDQAKKILVGEKHPSMEMVTPEEIGALAIFLCGNMARSITGTTISIDGGWTAI